jgi:hypothetical protein
VDTRRLSLDTSIGIQTPLTPSSSSHVFQRTLFLEVCSTGRTSNYNVGRNGYTGNNISMPLIAQFGP